MSNDLRTVKPEYKEVLLNKEMIAVDQDPLGRAGRRVSPKGDTEVWARELEGGALAVALLNKAAPPGTSVTARFPDLGLGGSKYAVRDLWEHKDLGVFSGQFSATVPMHGVVLVKLTVSQEAPSEPRVAILI